MMATQAVERFSRRGRLFLLWLAILGPAAIWAVRIGSSYILIPFVCAADQVIVLHAVSAAAALAILLIGAVAWRSWREAKEAERAELNPTIQRARFMALFGLFSSGLFLVAVLAEWLVIVFIHPCLTGGAPAA